MRPHLLAAISVIALGACSQHDQAKVNTELGKVDHSADQAVAKVASNPDVRNVVGDVKTMGHDAAQEVRKTAAEAKTSAHELASDTKHAVHQASSSSSDKRNNNS